MGDPASKGPLGGGSAVQSALGVSVSVINVDAKEIVLKVVYYGPGLCGKTTTLQAIHRTIPSEKRPELISVETQEDRTLFFDYLPMEIGKMGNYSIRLQLYTVPGQVFYNSTRKLVLRGADGIVFVADSQPALKTANIESLHNLQSNLAEWGQRLEQIPHVIQYNKRDLDGALPVEELQADLNEAGVPYFETVADTGAGVTSAIRALTRGVLHEVRREATRRRKRARSPAAPPTRSAAPAPTAQQSPEPSLVSDDEQILPAPHDPPPANEMHRATTEDDYASVSLLVENTLNESAAAARRVSFVRLWQHAILRAKATDVEELIVATVYDASIIKSAQLVSLAAQYAEDCDGTENQLMWLCGIDGARYAAYRGLVRRALRSDPVDRDDALFVLHFTAMIALGT